MLAVLALLAFSSRAVRMGALAAVLAALLAAPAVWAFDTLGHATSGTFPAGGPASVEAGGPGGGPGGSGGPRGARGGLGGARGVGGRPGGPGAALRRSPSGAAGGAQGLPAPARLRPVPAAPSCSARLRLDRSGWLPRRGRESRLAARAGRWAPRSVAA